MNRPHALSCGRSTTFSPPGFYIGRWGSRKTAFAAKSGLSDSLENHQGPAGPWTPSFHVGAQGPRNLTQTFGYVFVLAELTVDSPALRSGLRKVGGGAAQSTTLYHLAVGRGLAPAGRDGTTYRRAIHESPLRDRCVLCRGGHCPPGGRTYRQHRADTIRPYGELLLTLYLSP